MISLTAMSTSISLTELQISTQLDTLQIIGSSQERYTQRNYVRDSNGKNYVETTLTFKLVTPFFSETRLERNFKPRTLVHFGSRRSTGWVPTFSVRTKEKCFDICNTALACNNFKWLTQSKHYE